MNPPYNAKPIGIPSTCKARWDKAKSGKEAPTKGLLLLPPACVIGTSGFIKEEKEALLEDNTLEAVFSLPTEMFYPGASVCACCMLFTLGQPHAKPDGTMRSTFFGYCKDDGFVKKKNLDRVEQFNKDDYGNETTSKWKEMEKEWLDLFERKAVVDGKSAAVKVNADDEWLCEAYMKTDHTKLTADDFRRTLNNYLSYLVREGKIYENDSET